MQILAENMPWVWLAAAVLCLIIEACTLGLTTVWFALSAFVMIPIGFTPLAAELQVLLFLLIACVLLVFTRPAAVKKLKIGAARTNIDSLHGKKALVITTVHPYEPGEIKINGVVWSAQAADGGSIAAGSECMIDHIEGTTAVVTKL
ncbi:MAG TPA: NfeD family protein [Candidatus Treponema faecavium]|nr:NfeD family protein [Candidatus Treponema faecavium]